ncbi:MAG TPA: acyltransferase [Aquabacterium sp.]|nr:acyltransferase [Aquabacterium sp.]
MGLIRTLLALAVVLGHTQAPYLSVGGRNAVQMFYAISGFLISYVWVERRSYANVGAFYANRYLRLYPIYAVVGLFTLLACAASIRPEWIHVYQQAPEGARWLLGISNAFILGQDWIMFLAVKANQLVFSSDFRDSDVQLWQGLLAPQAWTLGVELSFYLVAPFILRRRSVLFALLGVSLVLRLWLVHAGLGLKDPWDYRFFPTELALFILGALSHQVLRPWYARLWGTERQLVAGRWASGGLAALVLVFPWLPGSTLLKSAALFAVFLPCLPLLFAWQSASRVDRAVGELSYPIYVSHWLVIDLCAALLGRHEGSVLTVVVLPITLAFAYGLNRWVGEPVERWRDRLRDRA